MTVHKTADEAHRQVVSHLKGVPGYVERFRKVFGTGEKARFNWERV